MDGVSREDGREPARGNPTPPVTHARQVGENCVVGTKRLGARGGDAADPIWEHARELDPTRCRHVAEQEPDREQGESRGSLGGDECTDQEDRLVASS